MIACFVFATPVVFCFLFFVLKTQNTINFELFGDDIGSCLRQLTSRDGGAVTPPHATQSRPRMQTSTTDATPFFPHSSTRPPFWESRHQKGSGPAPPRFLRGPFTMVHTCVVAGCRNRRTPGTALSFYRFPRDPERKQRWIAAVNREGWVPNDGSRLCSTHFISGTTEVCCDQSARTSLLCSGAKYTMWN